MGAANKDGQFEVKPLAIIGGYNVQRFPQFGGEDCANWYIVKGDGTKRQFAMYPTLGRAHINYGGLNQLVFGTQPRQIFKTIDFAYIVEGNTIFKIDSSYAPINISGTQLQTIAGPIYFTFLVVNTIVFAVFVDQQKIYVYQENTGTFSIVTDPNAPGGTGNTDKPGYVATFGNRIVVSVLNSSQFVLSVINLLNTSGVFDPNTCFTNATGQVFAREDGIIRQMAVLNNTLYIFTDYVTGVWSNNAAIFTGTGVSFPWRKNSTYNWNFGIANPASLDVDFGYIAFLARNSDGLLQFMISEGGQPRRISTKAIDTLLQNYTNALGSANPFLAADSAGFLYEYENTIFYRMSGGKYTGNGILDQEAQGNSIEYNFEGDSWHRLIELNGERNRVQNHVFFNFKHLVTVVDDNTVYDMSGQYYFNENRNLDQSDPQAIDAYLAFPFRYERVTPIISQEDYSEFETEYVEIDFVFGDSNISFSTAPFANAEFLIDEELLAGQPQFLISEQPDSDGQPVFMLSQNSNFPTLADTHYNALFKPSIELFYADDGGIDFHSADVREFSQMGVYEWKMRWYQLGPSRNRVYNLIAVSPVPIVILGAVMNIRRISGGAN